MSEFHELVAAELARARRKNAPFHTRHEGLAVIEEEFLELRAEVFRREPHREKLLGELVQVAAMCQRFAEDLLNCPPEPGPERLSRVLGRLRTIDERFAHFAGVGRGLGGPLEALGEVTAELHDAIQSTSAPNPQLPAPSPEAAP